MTQSGSAPLAGITIVAMEQAVSAPMCTRVLADFGARVIKIENPKGGDFARDYDDVVNGPGRRRQRRDTTGGFHYDEAPTHSLNPQSNFRDETRSRTVDFWRSAGHRRDVGC